MSYLPLTTITTKTSPAITIDVSFGPDPRYALNVLIDPSRMMDDDIAADGIGRPSARLLLGGLNADRDGDQEITVERHFGEDELRAMAKAMLTAAGRLRRIESNRRRMEGKAKAAGKMEAQR